MASTGITKGATRGVEAILYYLANGILMLFVTVVSVVSLRFLSTKINIDVSYYDEERDMLNKRLTRAAIGLCYAVITVLVLRNLFIDRFVPIPE